MTSETQYVVTRMTGTFMHTDYLAAWDILWGPVWVRSLKYALRFTSRTEALEAMSTASVIMTPRPWCVPNFGRSRLEVTGA